MRTTEIQVPLTLPPPKTPRSSGVHVSNIIRCIAIENKILKSEQAEELSLVDSSQITDPIAVLRMCIGLAWEEWYIPTVLEPLMGVADHPGEMQVDGVYMTHDGEAVSTIMTQIGAEFVVTVHEVKVTYKSTRTVGDVSNEWLWLAQLKAYCKALNTRYCYLHVLFLCGDYSYPLRPVRRCWCIEFETEEIERNWTLLTDYKAHREHMAVRGTEL